MRADRGRAVSVDTFRRVVERLPSAIVLARWESPPDAGSFRFIWGNEAARTMSGGERGGVSLDEYLGLTFREAFPTLMDTPLPEKYVAAIRTGQPQSLGSLRYGKPGHLEAVFDIEIHQVSDDLVAVVYTNILEQVRAEEMRDHIHAELKRSNTDLEQFAFVASHDLRAPLRDIHHLASWIEEDAFEALPEASREHLRTLRSRLRRMDALLEDLLAYSRAGRAQDSPEPFELGPVVDAQLKMAGLPDTFVVDVDIDADVGLVRGPRSAVATVLRNLLSNAAKHRDRDDLHVQIRARRASDQIEITVADDGPGIAPQFHERVFAMFQTLKSRDEVEGTGLGLSLVQRLTQVHGGHVRLESEVGRGCRFTVTWPGGAPHV